MKNLTFLKTRDKTRSNKKITPAPLWGCWGSQKRKNPSFIELHLSYFKFNSSKNNDNIFKNLIILKTRDKTTLNKKNHPPPPLWGELGKIKKITYNRPKLGLLRRPHRWSDNVGNRLFRCNLVYIFQKGQVCPNRISSF